MERRPPGLLSLGISTALLLCLALALVLAANEKEAPPSEFLRFVDTGKREGRLETSVVKYRKGEVDVSLIAAVHVGDGAYYGKLEREFATYDALLYEMIKDKDEEVKPGAGSQSLISIFQRGLKDVLELEFQLDAIDYTKENFVHADMDPATFFRMQRAKGESFLSLMLNAMIEQWKLQMRGEGSQLNVFHLLAAFASEDSARALKYLLAQEFGEIEALLAGLDKGSDGEGSVILSGRNQTAIKVLRQEIGKGRKRLGIFYGAAHMLDLEKRLRKLGFKKVEQKWVTAWDVRKKTKEKKAAGTEKKAG